ncbi:MAG: protein phosphatase 2C domain-containing protein [Phycisphaerales bacterium]|nr:protein phosphatase 2C domain-containing protein [Phycisphaerales bacterium]
MADKIHIATEGANTPCQDRVAILERDGASVIALVDGAGGTGNGRAAADFVIDALAGETPEASQRVNPLYWRDALARIDRSLHRAGHGQSTCIVIALAPEKIVGASVGDSQAWLILPDTFVALTENQRRKPLLGDGAATPVGFELNRRPGTLLVASDGLFNYVGHTRILDIARESPPECAPERLINAARLRSGALNDDIAIALGNL